MRFKLLHAIVSGIVVASVLGLYLIPEMWQVVSRDGTFGPPITSTTALGITLSIVIIVIMLLSFRLLKKIE
jgi:hypothetical protein